MGKLLLNEQPLVVLPELACKIGLNEAIILQQLNYWINKSSKLHDGKRWVYNTYTDWQKQFPWWSLSTIKRSLNKLKTLGLIVTGNYNQLPQDRTIWYAINYGKIAELAEDKPDNNSDKSEITAGGRPLGQNDPMGRSTPSDRPLGQNELMGRSKWTNALGQNDPMQRVKMTRPLPETTTETTREQQQPQLRDDVVSSLVDTYKEITGNDDLRPVFLSNLIKSCHAVCSKEQGETEIYVLEKLELLKANLEDVKSPLRFFIAAMKEDWTLAEVRAASRRQANPDCTSCGGEGWVVSDEVAWECDCRTKAKSAGGGG